MSTSKNTSENRSLLSVPAKKICFHKKMWGCQAPAERHDIVDRYFSFVPNMTHNDGAIFMEAYEEKSANLTPNLPQNDKRGNTL